MINKDSELLKDWPASLVARQVKAFCVDGVMVTNYSDNRELLTALAKNCTLGNVSHEPIPLRKVLSLHNTLGNVLNHNVPVHITEHIIEVICNGQA